MEIKTTKQFKEEILNNKLKLKGKKIRIGTKTFIFDGAGDINLLFRHPVSGLSTRDVSYSKVWVRYEHLNPKIKKWLIKELAKIIQEEGDK